MHFSQFVERLAERHPTEALLGMKQGRVVRWHLINRPTVDKRVQQAVTAVGKVITPTVTLRPSQRRRHLLTSIPDLLA